MKVDNSRSSAPPNMNHRLRHRNRQILIWMAVLVFFTAACSGGSPHQTAVPSSAQSTAHLNSPSSSATAFKPSPVAGTVPNMAGMSLAAARAALATAGFDTYTWVYHCYGSPDIEGVDKQTPPGGARVPEYTHVYIYLQAGNC